MLLDPHHDDLGASVKHLGEDLGIRDVSPFGSPRLEEDSFYGYLSRERVDARIANLPRDLNGDVRWIPLEGSVRSRSLR